MRRTFVEPVSVTRSRVRQEYEYHRDPLCYNSGDLCECSTDGGNSQELEDKCRAGGEICSGNGECECGHCNCDTGEAAFV